MVLHEVCGVLRKLKVFMAFTYRNIYIDFQYKFKMIVDFIWSLANVIAFGFMGIAFQATPDFPTGILPYQFFLINTLVWTVFSNPFIDGSYSVTDEANWGTIGFMVANKVKFEDIALGRYFATGVRFFIIFFLLVPLVHMANAINAPLYIFLESLAIIFVLFLFMGGIVLIITAITIVYKRLGEFPRITLTIIRIVSTYFTPLATFGRIHPILPSLLYYFPMTSGIVEIRKMLILGDDSAFYTVLRISLLGSIVVYAMGLALTYIATMESRRKGTIEMY